VRVGVCEQVLVRRDVFCVDMLIFVC